MAVKGGDPGNIRARDGQQAVIHRQAQLADNGKRGGLEQIIDIVDGTGTGIFQRQHPVIGLTVFNQLKNITEFTAAELGHMIEMTGGILTGGHM